MGPGWRDYLLLAISAGFVALSILLFAVGRGDGKIAAGLVFFAACTAVAIRELVHKRRAAQQAGEPSLAVHVAAGEEILADRRDPVIVSASLVVLGVALALLGSGFGAVFVALAVAMALLGAGALAAMALGLRGRASLRFEPEALWVSDGRAIYPVPWDSLTGADLLEFQHQPVVRLHVVDAAALLAGVEPLGGQDPERARSRVARQLGFVRGWFGADVAILPRVFAVDPVVLLRAIERYAGDRAARAGLVVRGALDGEPEEP